MPGRDKMGPAGQGPMTGRRMGICNETNASADAPMGNGYGYGGGGGRGRGSRGGGGGGRGRGFGGGRGRGFGGGGRGFGGGGGGGSRFDDAAAVEVTPRAATTEDERLDLKAQAAALRTQLERLEAQLRDLSE
jgi:Family of unknown function (DUF5320)